MRPVALLTLALIACNGGEPKDDDGPVAPADDGDADADSDADTDADADIDSGTPPDTDTDTTPPLNGPIAPGLYVVSSPYVYNVGTALAPPFPGGSGDTGTVATNVVAFLRFDALFGFDGNGHVVETTLNGETIDSTFNVYFGTADWEISSWSLDDAANYCTISFPMAGGTLAPWVSYALRLYWGTEYNSGPLPTTCGGPDPIVDISPLGDPVNDWENQASIGAAVGGLLPATRDLIEDAFGDDMIYVIGGQFRLDPLFPTGPVEESYARAYAIDLATLAIEIGTDGELVQIEADDIYPYP